MIEDCMAIEPLQQTALFDLPIELTSALISAIVGFGAGLAGHNYQRWLERKGKVICQFEDVRFALSKRSEDKFGNIVQVNTVDFDEAENAFFSFKVILRNKKDIEIEVRDPAIIFKQNNKTSLEVPLKGAFITLDNPASKRRGSKRT